MIWDSTALMTVIDLVIVTIAGAAIWVVVKARADLSAGGALRAATVLIAGLVMIACFYFVDLLTMHALPLITSQAEAMATMESLHLNLGWVVSAAAVLSIFVGFVGIVRSEIVLTNRLRSSREELRDSAAERESIEATLASVEDRLERALRAAGMGTWAYDPVTEVVEWSEGVAEIFGLPPEQAPTSFADYSAVIHPDDRDMVEARVAAALAKGGSFSVVHRILSPEGETRWLSGQGWVYSDEEGRPTVMTGVVWDITDQRRALEAKEEAEHAQAELNRRLIRQQRLESLGTLSGGIAHDFNNLLTPILGNVEMLREDARDAEDGERLEQIRIAAERARGLVRQILAFSGNVEPAGGVVDVAKVVGEALDLVRATLPSTIEIRRAVADSAGSVAADPTQLTQVLVNLCTNSAHAMPAGGVIEVHVAPCEVDRRSTEAYPGLSPGSYVRITVSDTGTGMSEPVAERAFEPFFSTKEVGEGTGLGLSQVLGIVTTYGGTVTLDSEQGRGTTVNALLPVVELATEDQVETDGASGSGSARVLIVDDEPAVAELLGTMLGSLGFEVTTERDPITALERFRRSPEAFDLLLTDQTMPGMTGTDLAENVRQARPGFPTILTSGFTDPARASDSDVVFLMKPFTREQLGQAVLSALGETDM